MSEHILSIDPGKRYTGCALWQPDGTMVCAGLARNPIARGGDDLQVCAEMARAVYRWVGDATTARNAAGAFGVRVPLVVAERPQVYTTSKQRKRGDDGELHWTDPNDLPPLMGVDTGVVVLLPGANAKSYLPREWKGTLSKKAMNDRALERLSAGERARIEDAGALTHNILDAIGIGLHHLGRLARRRVYPR